MAKADSKSARPPSLEAVRARLDAIDAELLPLIDERASLAAQVAAAKAAAGDAGKFGLRPARENAILRKLLDQARRGAGDALVVRLWRELIGDSLARQGPFHLSVWGDRDAARVVDFARNRFGSAPPLALAARPEDALAAARTLGGVGVLALAPDSAWWGRLLAEPRLKVFAALPCLAAWGPMTALAVAEIAVEPTGSDQTFWVTDAAQAPAAIEETLGRDGVAATFLMAAGGLKLFSLAGFHQPDDPRLARAPGSLAGVIGAAPAPLDV
ncbi:chorismate mutase [Phenylobacterium sp.]|jgi:chorismate mutase|uniref:chorismate mutase n=1 Tax=Phenylobacterium sp. TaxID=1871053 RepID=UPI002F41C634